MRAGRVRRQSSRYPVRGTSTCGAPSACGFADLPSGRRSRRVVGGRALDLLQALPEALGGAADLLGLVPEHDRALQQREDRSVARAHHGRDQFPAGKGLAGRRAGRGRGCRPRASARAVPPAGRAISDIRSAAAAVHSSTFSTERCDSTSKRRMDSISSPKNSMRTGFWRFRREDVEDAAAHRVLADHLDRLAPLVADAFEVRDHIFERQFFAARSVRASWR